MSIFRMLAAAGAAGLTVAAAQAADLGPLPPPTVVHEFSGWYLRGNVGMTNQQVESLTNVVSPGTTVNTKFLTFDSSPFFGLGVGFQANNWLRLELTGAQHTNAHFHANQVATYR